MVTSPRSTEQVLLQAEPAWSYNSTCLHNNEEQQLPLGYGIPCR